MYKRTLVIPITVFVIVGAGVLLTAGFLWAQEANLIKEDWSTWMRQSTLSTPAHLVFVGDIMLARDVELRLLKKAPGFAFTSLIERLNGDVVLGNFEAAIPKRHVLTPTMVLRFSVRPELSKQLATAGFTHLSLANNHAFDYGLDGYQNTISVLESQGFFVAGSPNLVSDTSSFLKQVGDKNILITNINATYGALRIEDIISTLPGDISDYDLAVVYVHWGTEYELVHSLEQQRLAHQLIDNGFDLVVGHHPHVVQDIEKYKDGLIFYSLGNFIFDQYWNDSVQQGLLLDMVFKDKYWNIELVPVESKTVRVQPKELSEVEKKRFLNTLADSSSKALWAEISDGRLSLQF